ncbi:VWA domain-containing protein [Labrys sp. KNU-23]|uniref:vWA domain-containing protein n=1 Tax=Labrys sp. KNU-23 TaxID=2789216 RepID=UPI0011EE51AD|nr:VWA domain-containing protein [Labrys sp. KNU-23]QEN87407.1 VWA domain-containing protein [Labrys sp. KNU-23]
MQKGFCFFLLGLLGLAGAFLPFATKAKAEEGARVMLVLDASGSMWGKVGAITKIEAARQTVGTILKGWPSEDHLGLIAYGHRRKGDCADIEMLKPVGPVDEQAFMAMVGSLSPKGRTPMTDAVRAAADAMKGQEGRATIILVSDGVETCNADPCAVAASLKKANIGLVVDTVGFDIKDPEANRELRCMAEATGGIALQAEDAGELTKAIQQAVNTAQGNPSPPAPAPEPKSEPKAELKPDWNLTGYARLAAGDDPLTDNVRWELTRPAPEGVTPETVMTSYNADIHEQVAPGDYILTLTAGQASVQAPLTIKAGEMNRVDMALNAGRLGLRAKRTATETALENATWTVKAKGSTDDLFTSYDAETAIILPAGEYSVTLKLGTSIQSRDVEIAPAETVPVEIIAGVGKLKGKVAFVSGGPLAKDPHVEILAGAAPVDGESFLIDAYDGEPVFDLAAGTYRVHVHIDGVDRIFPLEIKAGETVTASFPLDAGLAALDAPGADSVRITSPEVDIYGEAKEITRIYTLPANYVLPAGKYKISAWKGDVSLVQDVEIKAGIRNEVKLALPQ